MEKTYIIKDEVHLDNEVHLPGARVEIAEAHAGPLIEIGAIVEAQDEKPQDASGGPEGADLWRPDVDYLQNDAGNGDAPPDDTPPADAPAPAAPEDGRTAAIEAAARKVLAAGGDALTKSGLPKIDALEAAAGLDDITGQERDAALAAIEADTGDEADA